jgi:hypothetical protein
LFKQQLFTKIDDILSKWNAHVFHMQIGPHMTFAER